MDLGDIIGYVFLGMIALLILWCILSSFCEKLAEPHNAKVRAIEKEENNQIEALKKKQAELDKVIKDNSAAIRVGIENEKNRYEKQISLLKTKYQELLKKENTLKAREEKIRTEAEEYLEKREKELKCEVWNRFLSKIFESIEKEYELEGLYSGIETGKLTSAFVNDLSLQEISVISKVKSKENAYNTTLDSCDCVDFQLHHKPCKHMLFLAYTTGVMLLNGEKVKSKYEIFEESVAELGRTKQGLQRDIERYNKKIENNKELLKEMEVIVKERAARYPIIAGIISDLYGIYYDKIAKHLDSKARPAHGAAETVRSLKREAKALAKAKKELEFKLAYIQELFPNINDIFESGFNDEEFELETEENTDRVRLYLSDEEYRKLTVTERNQRALDNYVANRKSKWQVGRDYEMYIGYLCEQKGYKVEYTGIIQKLEDMGRDLIATKDNEVLVIQCKNWAQEKTIHEKHIFQLYGTVIMYSLNSMLDVKGVFITTTKLSKTAKQVADYLGIIVLENEPLGEFPRIKCNINRDDGEKIYHLPFDQQYDKTVIDIESGECYAITVAEAESKGYRRAFKHHV